MGQCSVGLQDLQHEEERQNIAPALPEFFKFKFNCAPLLFFTRGKKMRFSEIFSRLFDFERISEIMKGDASTWTEQMS
mgnify:CR=1 FL=1